MANTSAIWQHAKHTTDQLSSPNQQPYQTLSFNEKLLKNFWKRVRRMSEQIKKKKVKKKEEEEDKTERVMGVGRRTRQEMVK